MQLCFREKAFPWMRREVAISILKKIISITTKLNAHSENLIRVISTCSKSELLTVISKTPSKGVWTEKVAEYIPNLEMDSVAVLFKIQH